MRLDDVRLAHGKIVSKQDASRAVLIADAMRHGGVERIGRKNPPASKPSPPMPAMRTPPSSPK
jgi:hypothetical protein